MTSNDAVKICRGAVRRVGSKETVSDIENPKTLAEKICEEEYDDVRQAALRCHPWNFATKRIQISAEIDAPVFGFKQKYKLPTDFIRVVQVGSWITDSLYTLFTIENGYLLLEFSPDDSSGTDPGILNLVYIFDEKNVGKWDPLFKEIVKLMLAEKMFSLHQKSALQREIVNEINEKIPKGRGVNGQDVPPKVIERSHILDSRNSGGGMSNKFNGHYFR